MDGFDQAVLQDPPRTARGRWAPGQSGNPAGKKPGTRNRASRLRELLADEDLETAVRVLREQLQAGDGVAARFILDRMFPKPRDRDIDLGLPPPEDGTTVADLFDRVLWLMAAGEITIDEASRIARLIQQRGPVARARDERPPVEEAPADSPAFDLQTAGEAAAPVRAPQPANRHERRRAAALQRTGERPPPPIRRVESALSLAGAGT